MIFTKYRIIVADDDSFICQGICKTIEQFAENAEICGVFNTGEAVLDFLKSNTVDVVISDIKMPGMTGLDIAKFVKKKNQSAFVVLITGHLVFEYAKTAIDTKVDYLLTKPFSSAEFIKVLAEIETRINKNEEQIRSDTKAYLNEWKYLTGTVKQVFGGGMPASVLESEKCCVSSKPFGQLKISLLLLEFSDTSKNDFLAENEISFDSFRLSCFYLTKSHQFDFALVFFEDSDALKSYINDLSQTAKSRGTSVKISTFEIGNLSETQALESTLNLSFEYFYNITHMLGNIEVINTALELKPAQAEIFLKITVKLLNNVGIRADESIDFDRGLREILEKQIPSLLPTDAIHFSVVDAAIKYIEKNYSDYLLSLSKVAESLHISSDYLGKLFKTHLNTNYTDFVADYRFKKAKELLKTTDMSIAQIGNAVGYNDIQYFRKIFKKKSGFSPVAYRKYELIGKIYED